MDIACCMAMNLVFMHVFLMALLGILKASSRSIMDGLRLNAWALAANTINGVVFHHCAEISS
jgi:hypothetical protein